MSVPPTTLALILTRSWTRRGILACLLWPLSMLFQALVALRRRMYAAGWLSSTRLPVPVIVVGNIFIGGTGKTPLTIWLVEALRHAGYVPGVISRGYGVDGAGGAGGADGAITRAVHADASAQQVGDEPLLIARRTQCPVMIGRNRVAAAQALLTAYPNVNVIVSDDGLQHYAMQRDIEIVLFDARGVGNGWLLPAGPLREPASRRRDFTVVNAAQPPSKVLGRAAGDVIQMELLGVVAERLCDRSQRLALTSGLLVPDTNHQATRIVAAAGIGNPARFFSMLRAAGLTIDEMALADHYDFADNPFAAVLADIILITEKDAVKCDQIASLKNDPRLWVVPVTARIDEALAEQIVEKLRGHTTA